MIIDDLFEATQSCPHCGGPMFSEMLMMEKKDACYYKVKASAKVWPSAYASGRLVQCRKKGAGNYGNKSEGVAEGSLEELANTSLKVKEPKDFVNTNDRKQVTYKVMKFKSGKDTYLINFTVKGAPAFGKKSNWNAVNVGFGVREEQDDYSFGDEMNTDLTAKNKNQFLIYSTVINAIRKFITEYNTEIDEIIMQGAGERQVMMYQRFFRVAPKYFPGWHHDGKHSLVRDVPRQTGKKVREQGVAEAQLDEKCWDGYEQQGMKNKSGRQVPNCVPTESVNEMDKSQTPPGRDGSNDSDASKKEYTATPTTPGAVVRQGGDILNKAFRDSQRVDPRTGKKMNTKGVAEGLPQTLRKVVPGYAKREIDKKMDAGKFGKTDVDKDANFQRYKKIQDKIKEQGVAEEAPPGDKAERMVKHIKKSYAKDGKITDKEKGIAYATAWKAHNAGKVEEAQYDRGDYYNARMAGEYGKGMSASLDGGGGDGPGRGDIHKGQTKHLPADPFGRASGDAPQSGKGKIYTKALPDEMDEGEQQKGADYRDPPEADYGDDYQDMVARVKKLAGLGPLKTVYDPARRVYRNMPTAQQPKK